ncbi:RAB26 [Symbiodinium natans]|uniref:RAB26 protein n=1 Tax=Symbiodinium natans TaxID=878477 RepID=A0A812NYS6_9DINO|nr:RAB26 [Symbiodinium natans]
MAAMEPLATLRPVTYEPIAGRREEPRRSRVAREPEPHIQEPRSREAASACGAEVPPWPEAEPQAPTAAPEPQKPPVAERPSDLVAALAPKDPLPPDAVELPILSAASRKQEMPADPPPHIPEIAPSSSHQVVTQAMAQELSIAQSRIQARSLDAWHRHLTGLERWQLLSVVWRLWAGPAKVSALRARLELVLLDELRLAKAREEVQRELSQFLRPKLRSPELWPQVFGGPAGVEPCGGETSDGQAEAGSLERKLFIMKSFIFEFRKRVAEAVAELPGALNGFAEGQAFQTTLEIGAVLCLDQVIAEVAGGSQDPMAPTAVKSQIREGSPRNGVVLKEALPAGRSVAVLLQSLQGASTGRLSLLRGTELLARTARLGELNLTEDESLHLVRRTTGKYTTLGKYSNLASTSDHDVSAKCLLIGGAGSGKSSLLRAVGRKAFVEAYTPTVGVEFSTFQWLSEEGLTTKLQVWDAAGLERFKPIETAYYKGAQGFLAVFSLKSRASLEEIRRLIGETQEKHPESCRCICMVGTHADAAEPEVTQEEALEMAAEQGWPFFAVSCKTGERIDDPFYAWHASLFLYQKLRTLVPSELEETMRDPVSRLVPVPFYVLPYKARGVTR